MNDNSVGLMIYGDTNSTKNALTEDKYKTLANSLSEAGFNVESVLYNDAVASHLEGELSRFSAVLVWVNPIEQGNDRSRLDAVLRNLSERGVFISTHPDVILKIGTKKVLYSTRHMDWGGDIEIYSKFSDFEKLFLPSLDKTSIRILKQYRGNGGNGVYKVRLAESDPTRIRIVHAPKSTEERILKVDEFLREFRRYFDNRGMLINQQWVQGITNGMVRCYLTGVKVSGFGYQESNALCPQSNDPESPVRPTSGRFYFSEQCGLFQDLRQIMESKWVPQLQEIHSISDQMMPLLWDVDLFINDVNGQDTEAKYTLCEINVSCVSPFPPSCVNHVVDQLKKKLVN
ncbi:Cj0069 family protein [Echinicola rosea]|uniref:DUF6815 domain-containing protein n=1 Tax=Echinicola rosea TaxID=1807691 RepID=A0ABQ1VC23_9BACT|nr:Cj0069 family protein [Echinicola rosea]GGF49888.1 hypothetical protein GCM10011339_43070 [Echinicola rosea]